MSFEGINSGCNKWSPYILSTPLQVVQLPVQRLEFNRARSIDVNSTFSFDVYYTLYQSPCYYIVIQGRNFKMVCAS